MSVRQKVDECMIFIENIGAPPLSKSDYLELLESVVEECQMRMEGVQDEIDEEEEEEEDEEKDEEDSAPPYYS